MTDTPAPVTMAQLTQDFVPAMGLTVDAEHAAQDPTYLGTARIHVSSWTDQGGLCWSEPHDPEYYDQASEPSEPLSQLFCHDRLSNLQLREKLG